jgi:hypothetical protein
MLDNMQFNTSNQHTHADPSPMISPRPLNSFSANMNTLVPKTRYFRQGEPPNPAMEEVMTGALNRYKQKIENLGKLKQLHD